MRNAGKGREPDDGQDKNKRAKGQASEAASRLLDDQSLSLDADFDVSFLSGQWKLAVGGKDHGNIDVEFSVRLVVAAFRL